MTKQWMRLGIAVVLGTGLLLAQRPQREGKPPDAQAMVTERVNRLAARLSLTEDQKARATTIFSEAATATRNARTSMRSGHEALAAAVKANNINAIDEQAAALGAAHGQLTAIEAKAQASFYSILTADQKARFDEGRQHARDMMGRGGRFGRAFGPAR